MMEEIYTWDDLYSKDSIAPQRGLKSCRWKNILAHASKFFIKNEINFREKFSFHEKHLDISANPLSGVPRSIRRSRGIFSGISAQYLENFMT